MKKYLFICLGAILIISLIYLLIYLLKPFKIINYSPKKNAKNIGIDTPVTVQFNKKVGFYNFSIITNPETKVEIKKVSNSLNINFRENLKMNQKYTITLGSEFLFIDPDGRKTNQFSWDFITGEGITDEINDTNLQAWYNQYPLAEFTPYNSGHFSIDWPDDQGFTTIVLYATFNAGVNGPPIEEQEKAYQAQLKQYKQEALDWIKNKGTDPNTLKIKWFPEEALQY